MVAPDAIGAVCGQPVLCGAHEVVLDDAIAGVELGHCDHIREAAVVMGPLPEPVVRRRIAVPFDRVAEEVVAATSVVGHEVEQHPNASTVSRLDQPDQRFVSTVARLHLQKVLVVVSVMRGALVHRTQPEDVATQPFDVVDVLADSVQSSAVKRGRIARLRQALARPRETVDHDVVAQRVTHPIGRRGRC